MAEGRDTNGGVDDRAVGTRRVGARRRRARRRAERSTDLLDVFVERVEQFNAELNAFCYPRRRGRARARGRDRRRGRARRGSRAVGRRADGREGARRGRGLARHARVAALQGRDRRPRRHRGRRGCRPRARCSSGSRRRPSSARPTGRARTCTARPAIRGTRSARPAVRRAVRRPRSRSGMMPICTGSDGGGSIRIPSVVQRPVRLQGRASAGSATPATSTAALTSVPGPMCRSVRDAARYVDAIAGPTDSDPTSLPRPARRTRTRSSRATRSRSSARQARGVVVDARLRGLRSRGREARARGRARAVRRRRHRARRRRRPLPAARRRVGDHLESIDTAANYLDAARGALGRRHAGVARRSRGGRAASTRDQLLRALRRRWELLAAIADVFDEVDLMLTPTTATTAFVAEGPPPLEIAGQTRRRHGLGAVHRAVQHLGHARGEHPGRHERPTACPSGCRSSPAATTRSSCSRAARSPRPTAPGPSSPRCALSA